MFDTKTMISAGIGCIAALILFELLIKKLLPMSAEDDAEQETETVN